MRLFQIVMLTVAKWRQEVILCSFPLPNTHNEYCACMAAACRCLADKLLSWANEYDHGNDILNKQYDTVNKAFRKRLEEQE